MRADSSDRQWENDNLQEYDKASVGSSALLAALERNLAAEFAHWLGKSSAAVSMTLRNTLTQWTWKQ